MYGNMKQPKPPDRPLVPYMRYSRKMWAKVRAENPDAQLWDISKIIGQLWKEVPESEKTVYQHEYELEKVEYEKSMKTYTNSAAYQNYMNQKQANPKGPQNQKPTRSRVEVGGVVIQPVDEDSEKNELSARRIAAIRFDRNHRLIAELFNPSIVSDSRTVVAQQRIELLRKQAESLMAHQRKLEVELSKLDEVFNEKKRSIETTSENFVSNLKKVCDERVNVEQNKYDEMVEEWTGKLSKAYDEYKRKQEEVEKRLAAERERMAEKTPVLYNLTIGDDKAEEKKKDEKRKSDTAKNTDGEEIKKVNGHQTDEEADVAKKIVNGDTNGEESGDSKDLEEPMEADQVEA